MKQAPKKAQPKKAKRGTPKPEQPPKDAPQPFGYKVAWAAIPDARPREVAEALQIDARPCGWAAGLRGAVSGVATFISPPIDGYTFVVDLSLGDDRDAKVRALSRRFGRAQLFVSQRVLDDYACLEAKHGKIVRRATKGDEDEVCELAGQWSVDPRSLLGRSATPLGLAARSSIADEAERIDREELLWQGPARSPREASWHAVTTFGKCPGCGEPYFALWHPGRRPLPWETFAIAFLLVCSNGPCQRHFVLAYPPAATFDEDPAGDDVRIATSDARSELFDGPAWRSIVQRRVELLRELPNDGYDAETLARETRRFARDALGCAIEAKKHRAPIDVKLYRWLERVARDGLA